MEALINFDQVLSFIADPISKEPLSYKNGCLVNDRTGNTFPVDSNHKSPLLFPNEIIPYCTDKGLDWIKLINTKEALKQYFGMAYIKWNGGTHNSSPEEECYKLYLDHFKELVSDASGSMLDIGCDDPENTLSRFPKNINYLGIDPLYYLPSRLFKIFAVSEFLPFQNEVFDNVCFGTSLDHSMDTSATLDEANRILKPNGCLYLTTLIWDHKAELYNDTVHFHHFRENYLLDLLKAKGFSIRRSFKMPWKGNSHREGLFLKAKKNG